MNIQTLQVRLDETLDNMRQMIDDYAERDEDFSEEDQAKFEAWDESAQQDRAAIDRLIEREAALATYSTATERDGDIDFQVRVQRSAYDLDNLRFDTTARDLRAHAQTAIETDEYLDDDVKDRAVRTLKEVDVRGELAKLMLVTGNPLYRAAFPKVAAGHSWALTNEERAMLVRAQSLTNASGGFAVPFTLDPTILWTNDGAINPMRQIAEVKRITTDEWNGVTSAGATADWFAEAAEATDDSITLVQPNIPVHKMMLFVPYSIEIEMDWVSLENDLRSAFADAKDRLEAVAHFTGTGTGQPTGIVTALAGTGSEVNEITDESFTQADVFNLRRQLPPRYRSSRDMVSWVANLGTYDDIRQFDTGGGGGFWTDMNDGTPDRLTGYRTYESSAMDDAQDIDDTATANNYILLVGHFKRYVIVERVGMRIENIPHLFHTDNNRPSGQRGLFGFARTGADSVDDNAFRLLNVTTVA